MSKLSLCNLQRSSLRMQYCAVRVTESMPIDSLQSSSLAIPMCLESVLLNANRGFSVHTQPRQPMELRVGLPVFSTNRRVLCSRSPPRAMSHEADQFVPIATRGFHRSAVRSSKTIFRWVQRHAFAN